MKAKATKRKLNPLSIGTDLVAGIVVGFFLGIYLDKYFDLQPLFTILCSILGVAASVKTIYREMKNG